MNFWKIKIEKSIHSNIKYNKIHANKVSLSFWGIVTVFFYQFIARLFVETLCQLYIIFTEIPWGMPVDWFYRFLQLREVKKAFHVRQQANSRVGTETQCCQILRPTGRKTQLSNCANCGQLFSRQSCPCLCILYFFTIVLVKNCYR